ncbi:MAG: hypothetical protein PVS3B2_00340 [Candidatus Dormibacteraceae bacterium]
MTTAMDLIQASLEELRVYAPGETVRAADSARALWALNGMMDSWSNDTLACFAILEQSGVLQPGVPSYTVGTGGVFNVQRPIAVLTGTGAAYLQDTLGNNYPVEVVEQDVWNTIGNRTTTSQIPDTMFFDPQFPLAVVNVYPTPSIAYTLFWDSRLPLPDFLTLQTALSLPPGYQDAIQHNLTVRLKPFFKGAQLDPIIAELARETRAAIKRTNIKMSPATFDPEIVARAAGTYNIYRDGRGSGT